MHVLVFLTIIFKLGSGGGERGGGRIKCPPILEWCTYRKSTKPWESKLWPVGQLGPPTDFRWPAVCLWKHVHCGHTIFNVTMAANEMGRGCNSKKISQFILDQSRVDFEPGHSNYCTRLAVRDIAGTQQRNSGKIHSKIKGTDVWLFVKPVDKQCSVSCRMRLSFGNSFIFWVNRPLFFAFECLVIERTRSGFTGRRSKVGVCEMSRAFQEKPMW